MDLRTWDSSCSLRARLLYKWVQVEGGDQGWSLWAICGKVAQHFCTKLVFQVEMYVVLACGYEIQTNVWPEKYIFPMYIGLCIIVIVEE